MSLFDYVRCERELPDGYQGELQTKFFSGPNLLTHVITREGRLLRTTVHAGADPNDPKQDVTEHHDVNLTGEFRFGRVGQDYIAQFRAGQLVEIRIAENAATPGL
jgi:hypothetical protein